MAGYFWTPEEVALLQANAATTSKPALAAMIGRSIEAISLRLCKMKLRADVACNTRAWSDADKAILRRLANQGVPAQQIATQLGRTRNAVAHASSKFRFPIERPNAWTDVDMQLIRDSVGLLTAPELAVRMNRPLKLLYRKLETMRLRCKSARSVSAETARKREKRIAARPALVMAESSPQTPKPTLLPARPRQYLSPGAKKERIFVSPVTWCGVCSAPVVDSPQGWSGHYERVGCNRKARQA